jgi:hypothetical protein
MVWPPEHGPIATCCSAIARCDSGARGVGQCWSSSVAIAETRGPATIALSPKRSCVSWDARGRKRSCLLDSCVGGITAEEMGQPVCDAPMHAVGTFDRLGLAPACLLLARRRAAQNPLAAFCFRRRATPCREYRDTPMQSSGQGSGLLVLLKAEVFPRRSRSSARAVASLRERSRRKGARASPLTRPEAH